MESLADRLCIASEGKVNVTLSAEYVPTLFGMDFPSAHAHATIATQIRVIVNYPCAAWRCTLRHRVFMHVHGGLCSVYIL